MISMYIFLLFLLKNDNFYNVSLSIERLLDRYINIKVESYLKDKTFSEAREIAKRLIENRKQWNAYLISELKKRGMYKKEDFMDYISKKAALIETLKNKEKRKLFLATKMLIVNKNRGYRRLYERIFREYFYMNMYLEGYKLWLRLKKD